MLAARRWTSGLPARRLGVNVVTARRWTNGRPPTVVHVPRIARVLGVPVDTIEELLRNPIRQDSDVAESR